MNLIKERLNELIRTLKLSKNEFAREIGTSSAMVSKITTKDVNFGIDIYKKIIGRYPNLNQDWLLTGVGDMWNANGSPGIKKSGIITKANEGDIINKSYVDNDAPIYLERRMMNKVETQLVQGTDKRSKLYKDINTLLNFQYIISNLDHYYFENIDKKFYEIQSNYNGKKFDFEKYRSDIFKEIDKVMPFSPSLEKLSDAIKEFYSEAKPADTENIISGYLNN
ncbi:MAG: helix-turn-helix transcriptional regulator [Daejeonella sp.]|uniref:helix-turn-helix domain-containing protein n=1 Tax=Daejeonella sp. TaxID=2805397 RepID=UPI0027358609|nr:helix-turn-helix transcriptional regulator [Daejeonella sp.]MDP3469644.1 helix-turn-helix transcriptional regulator [Daejeonella sp.]